MSRDRSTLQGLLYKLHDPSTSGTVGTPLFRMVPCRIDEGFGATMGSPLPASSPAVLSRRKSSRSRLMRERRDGVTMRELGREMQDWHLRQFEICPVVCEVRYISNRKFNDPFNESKHAPGFKRIGFIQSSTRVQAVESIHLVDAAGEKFQLWPFEITFYGLSHTMTGERTCVIGCESMPEQRHWIEYIEKLIEDKAHLSTERYVSWRERVISEAQSRAFKQFSAARNGSVDMESHVNAEAFRRARLINGKVFIDAEKAFHECAVSTELGQLALEVALMGDLMEELGLKVTGLQMDMFLEEIFRQRERRSGDDAELARELTELEVVSEAEFEHIFKTVFDNHTSEPSEQIKGKLLLIMSRSKNPFIQMLSIEEQRMLIDGRGADGSPNCRFKTFEDGSVIVRQGDEGHSMFIVVDGQLSVVVQFGSGPTAQKKEVATLPAGSVMGEMSLVLDKPRSATCIVKSGTCDVAEITKGALEKLMEARPYLQRELQEIVHRRDTANVLTGVNAKKKSTTLLEQKHKQETTTRAPARGQRAQGAGGGGGREPGNRGSDDGHAQQGMPTNTIVRFPRPQRVFTRKTKTIRPSSVMDSDENGLPLSVSRRKGGRKGAISAASAAEGVLPPVIEAVIPCDVYSADVST